MDEEEFDDETVDTSEEIDDVEGSSSSDDEEDVNVKSRSKKSATSDDDEDDVGFVDEKYFTEDRNWKGTRYFKLEGRTMRVEFSKFFGKSSVDYEEFITSCVSKKAYHKMMRLFAHTNNAILSYDKDATAQFMYRYFCIKNSIDNEAYARDSHQQFVNAVVNLFDINIMNQIRKFVNKYYIPTDNVAYEQNKRIFIPAITFLDYHIKILFVVSEMTHFVIPLCLEYLMQYRETNTNTLLVDTFTSLFPIAQTVDPRLVPLDKNEKKCNVYQKLYAFVETKIKDSLKSDEAMWERQAFLATNYKGTIEDIVNKLITNIVPEYSFKYNTMHLNVSVVRKSIQDYVFRKKDPFSINCFVDVDANTSDDDNAIVSEAEQFDSYNAKHDELPIIIRHTFMDHTVNKILQLKNVTLDPIEVEYYMTNYSLNEFQRFIIMSAFRSYFGGTENMYGLNLENWVKLMLCAKVMFERGGKELASIAKYITAKRERHFMSKKETRVSKAMLVSDPLYIHLTNTKYKNVKNVLKKNNFIEYRMLYLLSNEFSYNTPNQEYNGKIIPKDEDEIRCGVLKVFDAVIN